jgi:hypothetical protein
LDPDNKLERDHNKYPTTERKREKWDIFGKKQNEIDTIEESLLIRRMKRTRIWRKRKIKS